MVPSAPLALEFAQTSPSDLVGVVPVIFSSVYFLRPVGAVVSASLSVIGHWVKAPFSAYLTICLTLSSTVEDPQLMLQFLNKQRICRRAPNHRRLRLAPQL
jgi:hypothetical protein